MTIPESTPPAELAAMRTAYAALAELDAGARGRALRWLFGALDCGVHIRVPVDRDTGIPQLPPYPGVTA
ncbi:hypothetical protein BJY24_007897 [Nocardia transvalensis]|uniref:Uncharacterized protein n=1 Tax=Nocardia transvalensis TaxID=37333 RepID=A0A7W9UMU6_9NOCA|nr:hypothetical protein [Nocardia transvalensis]MBB5918964.1 hypothetical protein [Nocardia transvalensis]